MQDEWWYLKEESKYGPVEKKGPFSESELGDLLVAGTLTRSSRVWKPGRKEWVAIEREESLDKLLETLPAPLPGEDRKRLELGSPVRRFFARVIDLILFIYAVAFLTGFVLAQTYSSGLWALQDPRYAFLVGLLLVPAGLLAEALVFGLLGTTPGKWVLGLRVQDADGSTPGFLAYLGRQLKVYVYGLGLGIPIINLFTMIRQYGALRDNDTTTYDANRFRVMQKLMTWARAVLSTFVFVALLAGYIYLNLLDGLSRQRMEHGFPWENPQTEYTVFIPQGWDHLELTDDTGATLHQFISPMHKAEVYFASEPRLSKEDSLEAYATWWRDSLREDYPLKQVQYQMNYDGLRIATLVGGDPMSNDGRLEAYFFETKQQFWRILEFHYAGTETSLQAVRQLRDELVYSAHDKPWLEGLER